MSHNIQVDLPFWFKQRQSKLETIDPGVFKATGPNLPVSYLIIRADLKWEGALRMSPDGADVAVSDQVDGAREAMSAAFELYRGHVINV